MALLFRDYLKKNLWFYPDDEPDPGPTRALATDLLNLKNMQRKFDYSLPEFDPEQIKSMLLQINDWEMQLMKNRNTNSIVEALVPQIENNMADINQLRDNLVPSLRAMAETDKNLPTDQRNTLIGLADDIWAQVIKLNKQLGINDDVGVDRRVDPRPRPT